MHSRVAGCHHVMQGAKTRSKKRHMERNQNRTKPERSQELPQGAFNAGAKTSRGRWMRSQRASRVMGPSNLESNWDLDKTSSHGSTDSRSVKLPRHHFPRFILFLFIILSTARQEPRGQDLNCLRQRLLRAAIRTLHVWRKFLQSVGVVRGLQRQEVTF
ncbi:hypothetical protein BDW75DRAFT_82840 [Aspergillus navahoensis]